MEAVRPAELWNYRHLRWDVSLYLIETIPWKGLKKKSFVKFRRHICRNQRLVGRS